MKKGRAKPPHRECRMKNAECRMKKGRAKPPSCDIKATSMRVASQAVATLMRPQGSHKAPTKPGDGPWTTGEKLKLGKQKAEMGSLKANAEWRVI